MGAAQNPGEPFDRAIDGGFGKGRVAQDRVSVRRGWPGLAQAPAERRP